MIAMTAQARKIDARKGGSMTKKRIEPEMIANTLATMATTILTVRSWAISHRFELEPTTRLVLNVQ